MSAEANLAGLNNWILSFFFYEVILNLQRVGGFLRRPLPPWRSADISTQFKVAAHTGAHGTGKRRKGWCFGFMRCSSWNCRFLILCYYFSFQLLSFPLNDCPRYKQLMNETENTAEFINVTTKYRVHNFSSFKKILLSKICFTIKNNVLISKESNYFYLIL